MRVELVGVYNRAETGQKKRSTQKKIMAVEDVPTSRIRPQSSSPMLVVAAAQAATARLPTIHQYDTPILVGPIPRRYLGFGG